jgi:predicted nucleic acid-binding protein
MTGLVVSNSSPLIALDQIGQLTLLKALFKNVSVSEVAPSLQLPEWIIRQSLNQSIDPRIPETSLGAGEREAIALALELNATWILLDDRAARDAAKRLGLPVVGVLGALLAAKRHGLIPAVSPHLDELHAKGFFASTELLESVRRTAGEEP